MWNDGHVEYQIALDFESLYVEILIAYGFGWSALAHVRGPSLAVVRMNVCTSLKVQQPYSKYKYTCRQPQMIRNNFKVVQ